MNRVSPPRIKPNFRLPNPTLLTPFPLTHLTPNPQILSVYTSEDIQNAVGHRLFQDLSPWKMLCLRSDRDDSWPQWKDRLRFLEDLLRECREEFHSQTEPLQRPAFDGEEERLYDGDRGPGEGVSRTGDSHPVRCSQDVLSYRDGGGDGDSDSCAAVKKEESGNFQVCPHSSS